MKLDFSLQFTDLEGEVIERVLKDEKTRVPVTLGYIAGTALMSEEAPDAKAQAYELATRVYKGGVQEVSAEDITLIKTRVKAGMTAIIVGQALKMLEQQG